MKIHIYLPDDTQEWLREKAEQETRTISNFIHSLIEKERRKDYEDEMELVNTR